jgi:phage terminase large subunit
MATLANWVPLPWQIAPWKDKSPTLLLTGSAGGGKSRLAAEKINGYCWKYPGSCWLMLRKAREWTNNSVVPFFWNTILGCDPRIRYNKSEGAFYYPNGSVVYSGGMLDDKQRESVRSIGGAGGLDGAWMEEATAFSRKDREEIEGRIRHTAAPWQQLILTTNPDHPRHWIYTDLIQGGMASVYYSTAKDNPHNPPAYLVRLNNLTGIMGARLRDGKWVIAEGAIYDEYEPTIHIVDPFIIPSEWPRELAIDFGFNNPFVCQWWALHPDDILIMYREIYATKKLVERVTKEIIEYSVSENITAAWADHDAEDRATMKAHGITTRPANKDVSIGIQQVQSRLKPGANGFPRILFFRNALVYKDQELDNLGLPTSTIEEISGYSWAKTMDGKPTKDCPNKINDHGMDAMRYECNAHAGKIYTNGSAFVGNMGKNGMQATAKNNGAFAGTVRG